MNSFGSTPATACFMTITPFCSASFMNSSNSCWVSVIYIPAVLNPKSLATLSSDAGIAYIPIGKNGDLGGLAGHTDRHHVVQADPPVLYDEEAPGGDLVVEEQDPPSESAKVAGKHEDGDRQQEQGGGDVLEGIADDAPIEATDRKPPEEGIEGEVEILLTYELIALALQAQQTSVVSYRQPVASVIKSMGMNYDPHALSHYGGSPTRTAANQVRDKNAPRCWPSSSTF